MRQVKYITSEDVFDLLDMDDSWELKYASQAPSSYDGKVGIVVTFDKITKKEVSNEIYH